MYIMVYLEEIKSVVHDFLQLSSNYNVLLYIENERRFTEELSDNDVSIEECSLEREKVCFKF